VSHPVEPAAGDLALPHAGRLAEENQESGLEGVLGIVRMPQHPPADGQHHRSMPPQQRLERRLVALAHQSIEKLAGRQASQGSATEALEDTVHARSHTLLCPEPAGRVGGFPKNDYFPTRQSTCSRYAIVSSTSAYRSGSYALSASRVVMGRSAR